jgi:CBS domain-containing protein
MTLKGILKDKPVAVVSVNTETTISDVVDILAEKRIGAVLVLDSAGEMRGILSERDIVRNLAKHESATLTLLAKDLMTPNPTTVSPAATVADAMEIMTEGRFRHLPVVENGKLIGLVSIGDVVKARLSQQEHEVDSLRAYVSGGV